MAGSAYRRVYPNEGIRHEAAFKALAEPPDRYLGWLEFDGVVFSVRERSPFKDDFPTDKLEKKKHLRKMAAIWGEVLATEHKRASRSLNPDQPFPDNPFLCNEKPEGPLMPGGWAFGLITVTITSRNSLAWITSRAEHAATHAPRPVPG
ncbi:MAG: DUF2252 family protein [Pseudomonadota bacterium]|nr:DUF2252 family protein [Pseudomonadota bacterium]